MALRLGIDMDGTIADLSSAYREIERTVLGERSSSDSDAEIEESEQNQAATGKAALKAARQETRERTLVWQAIRGTEDFWLSLRPLEPGVVRQLYETSLTYGWEVFFITQRPSTVGQTVQRQTQQWLMREGFETPSVLTLNGGRGRAAAALELDFLLDDLPQNCVDVVSESRCRPILIVRTPGPEETAATQVGISVMRTVTEALASIEAPVSPPRPSLLKRLFGSGRA